MSEDPMELLPRVRVKISDKRFKFGVLVPKTDGTVILDGRARTIVQVDPKTLKHND